MILKTLGGNIPNSLRFISVHCQRSVPWNKLTFSCSKLFSVSGRRNLGSYAMRNRIVFIVEGRSRAVCFLLGLVGHLQDFLLLSFCFLPPVVLSFCQNVLMLHKQCSDNRWVFLVAHFFLNPENNVFSDCMFLAYFPFLHQQRDCDSSQMGQLYSASDLCVQVSCRNTTFTYYT